MGSAGAFWRISLAALGLIAAGLLASGCELELSSSSTGEFNPSAPNVLTVATEQVPAAGFWQGTVEHPTGGFEYGLARAMADRFGLDRVEIRTVPFGRMIEGDLAGADIGLRQLTPTPEREENLKFSIPYLSSPPGALVRSGTDVPDLKTAKELSWAVAEGTTQVSILEDQIDPDEHIVAPNQAAAIRMLRRGDVEAVLLDLPVALAIAQVRPRLDVAAQFSGDEALAVALPESSDNREAVDSAIRAFTADGTIGDLADEWLGTSLGSSSFSVPDVPLIR
jgi:polar amino acid transport system substrate-binding protein